MMKQEGILNSDLAHLVAKMGHKDQLVICDSGLPITEEANRIDLALTKGIPKFREVLTTTLQELVVEEAILAEEIKQESPELLTEIKDVLGEIPITYCSHQEFKRLTTESKGVVRSGEVIPFANIILISGVDF